MTSSPRSMLFLTYWSYEDPLVQAYVLPYLERIRILVGDSASFVLVTMEKEDYKARVVTKHRCLSITNYRIRYHRFGLYAVFRWFSQFWKLFSFCRRVEVSVVHSWCTPAGGIGYVLSLLLGIPLVLDSYEPHADVMLETGIWSRWGVAFNLLSFLERRQTLRASFLVAASRNMSTYSRRRYGRHKGTLMYKPAGVDLDRFQISPDKDHTRERYGLPEGTLMIYVGKFGGMYFDREIIQFAAFLKRFHFSDLNFLVLTNTPFSSLKVWCSEFGFPEENMIAKFVEHSVIHEYISAVDFALSPVRNVPSKLYCSPLKNAEYWACGIPVIISPGISTDSEEIEANGLGAICRFDIVASFETAALKIKRLTRDEPLASLQQRIRFYAAEHRDVKQVARVYNQIYSLTQ